MQPDKSEMGKPSRKSWPSGLYYRFFSVRGGGLCLCSREFIRRGLVISRGFLQSAEADFACVAANLFTGEIHREFVIYRGSRTPLSSVGRGGLCLCSREYSPGICYPPGLYYPLFLVRRGRRYPVQRRLKIAGNSCELAQDN